MIGNPALGQTAVNGVTFFQKFIPGLLGLSFIVGALIFFAMLIMGAIKWISSSGDKAGLESAKGTLTSAIIGLIILFSVFAIIKVIEAFFGLTILTLDISALVIQ